MNASGNSWIPPIFMYKEKCRKEGNENILPPGTTSNTTPKEHKTTEEFCKFLLHFNHHQLSGRSYLILDWHRGNFTPSVLNEAEKLNAQLLFFLISSVMSSSHCTQGFTSSL
jgi:hypothetical protein